MSSIVSTFRRDANHVPIQTLGFTNIKTIAFDGTTGKGAQGTTTLFTITGTVAVNFYGFCTEDLASAGGGTCAVGVAGATASLADQQNATAIDNHEVWSDAVLAIGGTVANHYHPIDQNIILTIGTADVTNGTIDFYVNWVPLSPDANLENA